MTSPILAGRFIEGNEQISFPATDLVRVVMKSLHGLGLRETVAVLEKEAGLTMQTREVEELQRALLAGDWATCLRMLDHVRFVSDQAKDDARRMILEEKYLELLEEEQIDAAMQCLQTELREACEGASVDSAAELRSLQVLASYLVCPTPENMRSVAKWSGVAGNSRVQLMDKIGELISPQHMVKEGRLETLVTQALQHQLERCEYHNPTVTTFSLLEDVRDADPSAVLPQHCVHTLEDHTDEVWYVAFSHDGRFLASASKDKSIKVWEFRDGEGVDSEAQLSIVLRSTFRGHEDPPHLLRWNYANNQLLSSSGTPTIFLWSLDSSRPVRTYRRHTAEVTGIVWLPPSNQFVTASLDRSVLLWHVSGSVLATWGGYRIVDLAIHPSGEQLFCASADTHLIVLEFSSDPSEPSTDNDDQGATRVHGAQEAKTSDPLDELRCQIVEVEEIAIEKTIVSLHIDDATDLMLISFHGGEIQLYSLTDRTFLQTMRGQRQSWFVLRPALGGEDASLTISGSEDSRIYIWHSHSGRLLTVLKGHSGTVNCVAWRPGERCMFASASDDSTIKIWSSVAAAPLTARVANGQLNGSASA